MNTVLLKKNNLFKVISVLKNNGPMTKPDISHYTELAQASVHNYINELMEKGVVSENGQNSSNGGRKAAIYSFNSEIKYIAGICVELSKVSCGIFDLDFNEIYFKEEPMELEKTDVQTGLELICNLIETAFNESGKKEDIIGIGITVPGPVDRFEGVVLRIINAEQWTAVPLKAIVEEKFSVNTRIENDNNGLALLYKWTEMPEEKSNIVHISIINGIGSGIIVNGGLYQGSHSVAGEIGHISVAPNGKSCRCGNNGCAELYSSNAAIIAGVEKELEKGIKSSLAKKYETKKHLEIADIVEAAKSNDMLAYKAFISAAEYIVICLDNVIKMFDPEEIIFYCRWMEQLPDIFNMVVNQVFNNTKFVNRNELKIKLNTNRHIMTKGAAALQYDLIFGSYTDCPLL